MPGCARVKAILGQFFTALQHFQFIARHDQVNMAGLAANRIAGQPRIMTAVEVQFVSEVGKTYRIQRASSIDGGWVDVTGDIPGGGGRVGD